MVLTFYDSIFVFKNYNILILYDYRYYYDFIIEFNIFIQWITGCPYLVPMSEYGQPIYHYSVKPIHSIDKLYIID